MNLINKNQIANLLEVTPRQASNICSRLESLGFNVTRGMLGDRRVPEPVVLALIQARKADRPFESLLADEKLVSYRAKGEVDPLQVLVEARADLTILRQSIAPIVSVLENRFPEIRFDWQTQGVPDPESEAF